MKKMLATLAVAVVILGLSTACEKPPTAGDFNVQWKDDTSTVKTVVAGEIASFKFYVNNNTANDMTFKIDAPNSASELPAGWNFQICVDIACMAPGAAAYALSKADTISDSITFDIMTVDTTTATQGTVTMMISDSSGTSAEVDTVVFTAKIQQ